MKRKHWDQASLHPVHWPVCQTLGEPGCSPEGTSPVPLSPDPTPSQDTALSLPEPPYAQGEIPALVPQSFSV